MVDRGGYAAAIRVLRRGAVQRGEPMRQLADPAFQQVPHRGRVAARGAGDGELGRHHIRTLQRTALDRADADDGTVHGGDVAPDDGLECQHEMRLHDGEVGRQVRRRTAMPAGAVEGHGEAVRRRQRGPRPGGELPRRNGGLVVQPVDGVAGEAVEQAIIEHGLGTAAPLFGGLEDQVHGAGEIAVFCKPARRAQQHGGVAVMAAGMHQAGVPRGVGNAGRLRDRQRVHVCTQADHALAGPGAADGADDAELAHAGHGFDAPAAQMLGDEASGAQLLHAQFGVGVDVLPDGGEFGQPGGDGVDHGAGHAVGLGCWVGGGQMSQI